MRSKFLFIVFLTGLVIMAASVLAPRAHGIRLMLVKHLFDLSGGLSAPSDVAVSKGGRIYIVDGVHHRVVVFDSDGQRQFSFGRHGSEPGEFDTPVGIDVDDGGTVYIADARNGRVQLFTEEGGFVRQIRLPSLNNRPADPVDVAVTPSQQRCIVTDNDNHRLLVVDLPSGEIAATFGEKGTESLQFRYPFLTALDRDANLYVVDVINTRLQVIGPTGNFRNYIGGWGVAKGQFFRPKGVALDAAGRVLVSDSYLGVVQVFAGDGTFHAALGEPERRRVKKFRTPVGLHVDQRGRIYVVEMLADKVSVYAPAGEAESY